MIKDHFNNSDRGRVIKTLEGYEAFIPNPLPRQMNFSPQVVQLLDAATGALHRLAGISRLLSQPALLLGPHIRLEAVLSSRIEGTQSNIDELLRFETGQSIRDGEFHDDVAEVHNYVIALEHGMKRVDEIPISVRLLNEVHELLMREVRGNYATPGKFRKTQNWIGGRSPVEAIYVPPPVDEMKACIADWEKFVNARPLPFPLLICIAVAHYQFEAIHPYLDGNGRVGRLLIPLMLREHGVLQQPLL